MNFVFDADLHVHSTLSLCCADPRQTPENILRYAEEHALSTVCLTNHFWDSAIECTNDWYRKQDQNRLLRAKPLPQSENVRFLFGCETEVNFQGTLGISEESMELFDFIIIPPTHFHKVGFTVSEEDVATTDSRVNTWLSRMTRILSFDLPFHKVGIAHIVCPLISRTSREEYLEVLKRLPEKELFEIFSRAAEVGVGVELNARDFTFSPEEESVILRPFRIARECGCKFYTASDAHSLEALAAAPEKLRRAAELLCLEESEKFILR